jgi:hypothetical protein
MVTMVQQVGGVVEVEVLLVIVMGEVLGGRPVGTNRHRDPRTVPSPVAVVAEADNVPRCSQLLAGRVGPSACKIFLKDP